MKTRFRIGTAAFLGFTTAIGLGLLRPAAACGQLIVGPSSTELRMAGAVSRDGELIDGVTDGARWLGADRWQMSAALRDSPLSSIATHAATLGSSGRSVISEGRVGVQLAAFTSVGWLSDASEYGGPVSCTLEATAQYTVALTLLESASVRLTGSFSLLGDGIASGGFAAAQAGTSIRLVSAAGDVVWAMEAPLEESSGIDRVVALEAGLYTMTVEARCSSAGMASDVPLDGQSASVTVSVGVVPGSGSGAVVVVGVGVAAGRRRGKQGHMAQRYRAT